MIAELLRKCGDPDWSFFLDLREGVPLGVGVDMPRVPAVFEAKERWNLAEADAPEKLEAENYSTVEGHEAAVEKLFREEQKAGWMVELTDAEAKAEYGDRLRIAALAVVVEPTKIRVVHDASNHVGVNHRIRPKDQTRSPGAGELRTLLQEMHTEGVRGFGLAGDVSKAHRRIKIRREDWGWQACRLREGHVWLNCVGTYGLASAAYYWARASGALLVRLAHYLASAGLGGFEALLYVDDFLYVGGGEASVIHAGFMVFVLSALGVPFRWDKFRGGEECTWIGFFVDLSGYRLGVTERRAEWVRDWVDERLRSGTVDLADLAAVLGRLCFALGPLEYLRPFLAPLYAWSASVGFRGKMKAPGRCSSF